VLKGGLKIASKQRDTDYGWTLTVECSNMFEAEVRFKTLNRIQIKDPEIREKLTSRSKSNIILS
jgi:hypothetical protein